MKTVVFTLAVMLIFPIAVGSQPAGPKIIAAPIEMPKYQVLETLTIYNPVENQCDNSPLVTANNSRIDLDKLHRNEIRWIALSRNLLKRWNGEYNYGDTVMVNAGDPSIDGLWVVNDNMNKRFKDRGDLLFHRDSRTTGIWKNVRISHHERKQAEI